MTGIWDSLVYVLTHDHFQQPLDIALLLGLAIDPVTDRLLLDAHMVDQTLDRFGQIRHRRGRGLALAGVVDRET